MPPTPQNLPNPARTGPGLILSALHLCRRSHGSEAPLRVRGRRRVGRTRETGLLAADAHPELARLDDRAAVVLDDGELARLNREAHRPLFARLQVHTLDARE